MWSKRPVAPLLLNFVLPLLLLLCALHASAQITYERLKSFGFPELAGTTPKAPLIEGSNGALYGTTSGDFAGGGGTVFKLNKDGSAYLLLHSFTTAGDGMN